jgi:hypothetical protein
MPKTYKERYKSGEFPPCFTPAPPFYDICNHGDWVINKKGRKGDKNKIRCIECFQEFGFVDYIE